MTSDTRKRYALKWAFEHIDMMLIDAVLYSDADTTVEPSILQKLNTMISQGRRPSNVI